ncbi:Integrase [Legionella feeleii]|uniref:Integrase n=1 Tax=Legionella feeleii TaxID=453 RepID=A0A378IQ39_9GAMM|nr:Integrase [Legionella feeleii]
MCQLLGITRHGYYSYQKCQRDKPDVPEHQELIGWVKQIAEASHYCYGSRRMKNALNALGYPVGLDVVKQKFTTQLSNFH